MADVEAKPEAPTGGGEAEAANTAGQAQEEAPQDESSAPDAPKVTSATPSSVVVTWEAIPDAAQYAVQISTGADSDEWTTLPKHVKSVAMRKKNLLPGTAYRFRVRGATEDGDFVSAWSAPSVESRTAAGVNPIFRNLLGHKVLANAVGKPGKAASVDLHELGGGLVGLYFSASWCPPCRQFTPMLKTFHESVRRAGGPGKFEVVFVSSDRTKPEFEEYFANHHGSWFALPFEAQRERQQCGSYFKVEGIPRLIIFGPDGQIVSGNAVTEPLNMATLARWQAKAGVTK